MRFVLVVCLLFSGFYLWAQSISPLVSDRPDQSDGAYVLPKNIFQIESGFFLQKQDYQQSLMLRYGLTPSTEIRLQFDHSILEKRYTILPTTLSFKQRLIQQEGILPTITLIGYGSYDRISEINSDSYDNFEAMALFAFQNDFSDTNGIEYNLGYNFSNEYLIMTFLYWYSVNPKLILFVEYFGDAANNGFSNHNIDGGALYHINDNFQLDIGIGVQIAPMIDSPFFNLGAAHRFFVPSKSKTF